MVTTLFQDIRSRADGPTFERGEILIDALQDNVSRRGVPNKISLKPMEYKVLLALMLEPERIFTGRELYEKAVGRRILCKPSNVAAVHVSSLRRKFPGLNLVKTHGNDGYQIGDCLEGPTGDFRKLRRMSQDGGACTPAG